MKKENYVTSSVILTWAVDVTDDAELEKDIFVLTDTTEYVKPFSRILCTRCNKGKHNTRVNQYRCKGKDCECLCRYYYQGLDGKLRKHGTPDDSLKQDTPPKRTKTDDKIDEINKEWRQLHNN